MKRFSRNILLGVFLAFVSAGPLQAERYLGDPREAAPLRQFLVSLRSQESQLQKLLKMLDRLEQWKAELNKENERLAIEGKAAKEDKKLHDAGKMTTEELNQKWLSSGRSLKHDGDLKRFKAEVARFNEYVRDFNHLATSLKPVIDKRSPEQVRRLVFEIHKLDRLMQDALENGNIEKAKYIAKRSAIASEFGYKAP